MTATAIVDTTEALRGVLEQAIGDGEVYVGPPVPNDVGQRRASLFLFHIEPNAELRNAEHFAAPPPTSPAQEPPVRLDALPLDLRYLISVFRTTGDGSASDPNELATLGQIIQALHATSTLTGARLADQVVRVVPEAYPMEELSRVWGLFPDEHYRTSVVYLASPVFVEVAPLPAGRRVVERRSPTGLATEPPDLLGTRSEEAA